MQIDFNRLKVFYYVYKYRTLLRASEELHVTQSALSQSLKHLEEELKTPLFVRAKKRLVPTQAAEQLFKVMQSFIHELDQAVITLDQSRTEPVGLLRIGAPTDFGVFHLIQLIARYREKITTVKFALKFGLPEELVRLVMESRVDFAFVDEAELLGDYPLDIEPIVTLNFVMACSQNFYKKYLAKGVSFESLSSCWHIDYSGHAIALKAWYKQHFKSAPAQLPLALSVSNVHGVVNALEQGLGLAVVPEYIVKNTVKSGKVMVIETDRPPMTNKIVRITLQGHPVSFAEKSFLDFYARETRVIS